MTVEIKNIKSLLHSAQQIANHQEEIKKLRGESFNVFSILKMERRENATHSAFVGELLNPKGSHLKGNLFLAYFIQEINYQGAMDIATTSLILENTIGNRDDTEKEGGRIDIYLEDAHGNSISIENKIYAIDQFAQIERYVKHNQEKNTVYYLTLYGKDAGDGSRGSLEKSTHYHCISYSQTIIAWLERCQKEAVELPILRESIRQYIILLKKLTHQLTDSQMEQDLQKLIRENYLSAKLVQSQVPQFELAMLQEFFGELKLRLEDTLTAGWTITLSENLIDNWGTISIAYNDWDGVYIALQGTPHLIKSSCVYGVVATEKEYDRQEIKSRLSGLGLDASGISDSTHWPYSRKIDLFSSSENQVNIYDKEKRDKLVAHVAKLLSDLAQTCCKPLSGIKKKGAA